MDYIVRAITRTRRHDRKSVLGPDNAGERDRGQRHHGIRCRGAHRGGYAWEEGRERNRCTVPHPVV